MKKLILISVLLLMVQFGSYTQDGDIDDYIQGVPAGIKNPW